VGLKILISAGEASGDFYASLLAQALKQHFPDAELFGCAGPRMRDAGVRPVVRAESLSVVGLVEVLRHIPRIYKEFKRLVAAARTEKPDLAILTDSPDFHLRLAPKLKRLGIPVVYLVAPQLWAWRPGRVKILKENVQHLLCIFPFEEQFFRDHGVNATYIGHPLTRLIKPQLTRSAFFAEHKIPADRPLVAILPGSRPGEAKRHLEPLAKAVQMLKAERLITFVAGTTRGFSRQVKGSTFWERFDRSSIQVIEGSTWDLLAHADLALAASGTVTIEAALLSTPMVAFYRVSPLSATLVRRLVKVPFLSMVNLVAGRAVVPELMQDDMTGPRLAEETRRLLDDAAARDKMVAGLREVRSNLSPAADPMLTAVEIIERVMDSSRTLREKDTANVR
jgi:lipid-A-disaccharide synthase